MITKQVLHNSKEYWKLVHLRAEILRQPLNLKFTDEELLNERDQLHFGIFEENKALACMVLIPQEEGKIKMRQVCVDGNYQGQRLGKLLNVFCEDYAKTNNFNLIHCNARHSAKAFYLSLGYQIKGAVFQEVGMDHYHMEKPLIEGSE